MAATIKDIARKLNISVSTVSYALNGGPRPVPERVREDVLRVARELDYRPNRLARSLITGRTSTIGVVPSAQHTDLVLSPYLQAALNGIVNASEELGQDVLIFTRCDQREVEKIADSLFDGRVDALILVAVPHDSGLLDLVRQHRIPYATIATAEAPDALQFACDNEQGVRLALEHLAELGHRKVGHLSGTPALRDAQIRERAFGHIVAELGLETRPEWMACANFESNEARACALQILQQRDRPSAIFCANDEMALGVCRAAASLGVRVPEDLSVVGFDDAPLAQIATPTITTVRQPVTELASLATHAVLRLIAGDVPVTGRTLPNRLIVRSSTARPASG